MRHEESNIQSMIANYLKNWPMLLYCGGMAGANLGIIAGARRKREGFVKGFPDFIIAEPRGKYHGFFLEVKTDTGVLSPEQKIWIESLNHRGYYACCAKGFVNCCKEIAQYLDLPLPDKGVK